MIEPSLSRTTWLSIVLNGICAGLLVKRLCEPLLEPYFLPALWYRTILVLALLANVGAIVAILYLGRYQRRKLAAIEELRERQRLAVIESLSDEIEPHSWER